MQRALLIHGTCDKEEYFSDNYPSLSNSHWFPWLQKQLLIKGIFTQTPEMPEAYQPNYESWKKEFERFNVNEETILVGHSCGGGFLVRWLTENKVQIKKLILVAPWLDPGRRKTTNFFDFSIDPNIEDRVEEVHIFVSQDDEQDILESVKIIKEVLPAIQEYNFKNMGHFTFEDMKTDKFPELLEAIL
ncbi:MAG: alpha/beta hydrolase [Patescibacteria group bacterium]|nr:alpha/beta hydrolase [Patescibacteria group bacterium]